MTISDKSKIFLANAALPLGFKCRPLLFSMLLPILSLSMNVRPRPLTKGLIILFVSITLFPISGWSVLWMRPDMATLAVVFCEISLHRPQ